MLLGLTTLRYVADVHQLALDRLFPYKASSNPCPELQAERGNDRAWLTLDLSADLRSIFNWNTKQVLLHLTSTFICASLIGHEVCVPCRHMCM